MIHAAAQQTGHGCICAIRRLHSIFSFCSKKAIRRQQLDLISGGTITSWTFSIDILPGMTGDRRLMIALRRKSFPLVEWELYEDLLVSLDCSVLILNIPPIVFYLQIWYSFLVKFQLLSHCFWGSVYWHSTLQPACLLSPFDSHPWLTSSPRPSSKKERPSLWLWLALPVTPLELIRQWFICCLVNSPEFADILDPACDSKGIYNTCCAGLKCTEFITLFKLIHVCV